MPLWLFLQWVRTLQQRYVQSSLPAQSLLTECFQVKFANKYKLPFLAVNQGHGTVTSLSNVKRGVNIYVHALGSIEVAADRNSALLGGGTYVDPVIKELATYGKVASMSLNHAAWKCTLLGRPFY